MCSPRVRLKAFVPSMWIGEAFCSNQVRPPTDCKPLSHVKSFSIYVTIFCDYSWFTSADNNPLFRPQRTNAADKTWALLKHRNYSQLSTRTRLSDLDCSWMWVKPFTSPRHCIQFPNQINRRPITHAFVSYALTHGHLTKM